MPFKLYESGGGDEKKEPKPSTSVVTGTVTNNCDKRRQGKVLVRIPSLDTEVWAGVATPGGGPGTGIQFTPQLDDDVVIAFNHNDPADSYILGGTWNSRDQPPVPDAEDAPVKRVIKSGLKGSAGHLIEMDDAKQSISIVSATKQKILIKRNTIEISNDADNLTITFDNDSKTIRIKGADVKVSATGTLTMDAKKIDMTADGPISIAAKGTCTIQGNPVQIN